MDEVYRLPPTWPEPRTLVDVGANIGCTSVWYWRRYPKLERIVAVEPVPGNAALCKENLQANRVCGEVVQAAIGPKPGVVQFIESDSSNLGCVGSGDLDVAMITMETALAYVGGEADMVKIDIEGGEQALLQDADVGWLEKVGALVVEFHPERIDYAALVNVIEQQGFRYYAAGAQWPGSMDMFRRR